MKNFHLKSKIGGTMKHKIWNYVIGVVLIVLGILFLIQPTKMFAHIIYYLGVCMLIVGILKTLAAFINKDYFNFDNNIVSGILNAILGIILMANSNWTIKVIPIFIGIWLIANASLSLIFLFRLNNLTDRKLLVSYIIKLFLGIIILATDITSVLSGAVIGSILIIVGIGTIITHIREKDVYKVRVKN